jgi:hypothetical protein
MDSTAPRLGQVEGSCSQDNEPAGYVLRQRWKLIDLFLINSSVPVNL